MRKLLLVVGLGEAAAGVALWIVPSVAVRLLFGTESAGVAIPLGRTTGIALVALGVGCGSGSVVLSIWVYTVVATLYLLFLGVCTEWSGPLLWPAVAVHAILTVLLLLAWRKGRSATRVAGAVFRQDCESR